jgi:hypothetical protein
VDTAGPTVGGLPTEGTWTGKSAVVSETVISGTDVTTKYLLPLTADDRVGGVAASGLVAVDVYRGAVLVGSKAWPAGTQNVPSDTVKIDLVAKTNDCSETASRNSLTIKVVDVAGNVTEVLRTLYWTYARRSSW